MRYRLVVLMLFAVLSVMSVLAAPAPEPYAILDIGPPPKGESAEGYCKRMIEGHTNIAILAFACAPVMQLPSAAQFKDPRPWLAKNIRVTKDNGDRCLRLTFRAGTRSERATIINIFLRADLSFQEDVLKSHEYSLRLIENMIPDLEKRIKSARDPQEVASYQKGIDEIRSIRIPEYRAEIARKRQFAVIKWAR